MQHLWIFESFIWNTLKLRQRPPRKRTLINCLVNVIILTSCPFIKVSLITDDVLRVPVIAVWECWTGVEPSAGVPVWVPDFDLNFIRSDDDSMNSTYSTTLSFFDHIFTYSSLYGLQSQYDYTCDILHAIENGICVVLTFHQTHLLVCLVHLQYPAPDSRVYYCTVHLILHLITLFQCFAPSQRKNMWSFNEFHPCPWNMAAVLYSAMPSASCRNRPPARAGPRRRAGQGRPRSTCQPAIVNKLRCCFAF